MSELAYLTPPAEVGVAPAFVRSDGGVDVPNERAGEPDPLTSIGLQIPVDTLVKDAAGKEHVLPVASRVEIRPSVQLGPPEKLVDDVFARARIIPGTRVVETDHPAVVNLLQQVGWAHCDPPKSEQSRTGKQSKEA